jgi:hypothetical protein
MLMAAYALIATACSLLFADGDRQKTERHNRSGAAVPSPRGKFEDVDKQR